jgi:hypothetical protein
MEIDGVDQLNGKKAPPEVLFFSALRPFQGCLEDYEEQ